MAVWLDYAVQANRIIAREFPQKVSQNGNLDKTIFTGFCFELQHYRTKAPLRNDLVNQQGLKSRSTTVILMDE